MQMTTITFQTQTLVTLGDFRDYHIWLALAGLVLTGSLLFHQARSFSFTCCLLH